jgi:hypothetical protein
MPLATKFKLFRDSQFFVWKKPEYQEKTTDLLQVTDKLKCRIPIVCHKFGRNVL